MPYDQVGLYGFNKSSRIILERMGERFRARAYVWSGDHKFGENVEKTFKGYDLQEVTDKALDWMAEEMASKPVMMHVGMYSEPFPVSVWDIDKEARMFAYNFKEEHGL